MASCRSFNTLVLMLMMAVPLAAHAGTLTIHNDDCVKWMGFPPKKKQRVTVHVSSKYSGCTRTEVTVHRGSSETIALKEGFTTSYGEYQRCNKYRHDAHGAPIGKADIDGRKDSSVTCKRDWSKVCKCTKD